MSSIEKEFKEFVEIIAKLRGKKGCPWDKEQTHSSLKPYMIEETYEALEAIDKKNDKLLKEELGDMLLHIIMHAQMAEERNAFTLLEVIKTIKKKIINRHPHVFSSRKAKNIEDIWKLWEKAKAKEKKKVKSIFDGIPLSLPALYRADKLQSRAARVGFDWSNYKGPLQKIQEEISELKKEIKKTYLRQGYLHSKASATKHSVGQAKIRNEIGDLLFSTVNLARKLNIDPEDALRNTIEKFAIRFSYIEKQIKAQKKDLKKITLKEMDKLWEKAKIKYRTNP